MKRLIPLLLTLGCSPDFDNEYIQMADQYREVPETVLPESQNYGIVIVDMQRIYLYELSKEEYDQEPFVRGIDWDNLRSFDEVLLDELSNHVDGEELSKELENQKRVLEYAIENDIPVLVFEMDMRGKTVPELRELIDRVPRHRYFTKFSRGGFLKHGMVPYPHTPEDDPRVWIREQGVKVLYHMGANTDYCVLETARAAVGEGFSVGTTADVVMSSSCVDDCPSVNAAFMYFRNNGFFELENKKIITSF